MKKVSRVKKFQFLLLDAGPIIKLFSLGIWDEFIGRCDVNVSRIIAEDQALYTEDGLKHIDLAPYDQQGRIKVLDINASAVKAFYDESGLLRKYDVHDGEKETLAFLCTSSENWRVCSADRVVFTILGRVNRANQGISLEEILEAIGIGLGSKWKGLTAKDKDWKYTKNFREKHTRTGQVDSIQNDRLH
jgi:hypothetical protein